MPNEYVFKARYADRPAIGDDVVQALKTLVTNDHYGDFHLGDYAGYTILDIQIIDHTGNKNGAGVTDHYPIEVRIKHTGKGQPAPEPAWTTFWARRTDS